MGRRAHRSHHRLRPGPRAAAHGRFGRGVDGDGAGARVRPGPRDRSRFAEHSGLDAARRGRGHDGRQRPDRDRRLGKDPDGGPLSGRDRTGNVARDSGGAAHRRHAHHVRAGDVRGGLHPPLRFAVFLLRLHDLDGVLLRLLPAGDIAHSPDADAGCRRVLGLGAAALSYRAGHQSAARPAPDPAGVRRRAPERSPARVRSCCRPRRRRYGDRPAGGAGWRPARPGWPRPR